MSFPPLLSFILRSYYRLLSISFLSLLRLSALTFPHKDLFISSLSFSQVHSKAQKRVPIPEGLDLGQPFNASAISKLLALEMPDNITLATLAFATALPVTHMEQHHMDDEETRLSRLLSSAFPGEDQSKAHSNSYPNAASSEVPHFSSSSNSSSTGAFKGVPPSFIEGAAMSGNRPGRSAEENLFYLMPGNKTMDILPLSQTLADAFEDKKVKRAKGAKKEKRKKTDFNMRDMLPPGAVSSDDDKAGQSRKDKKSGSRKKGDVRRRLMWCGVVWCGVVWWRLTASMNRVVFHLAVFLLFMMLS